MVYEFDIIPFSTMKKTTALRYRPFSPDCRLKRILLDKNVQLPVVGLKLIPVENNIFYLNFS